MPTEGLVEGEAVGVNDSVGDVGVDVAGGDVLVATVVAGKTLVGETDGNTAAVAVPAGPDVEMAPVVAVA